MTRDLTDNPGRSAVLRIIVTGSHGFIGSAAVAELERRGHEVWRLTRGTPHEREVAWNPSRGAVDAARLEGFDAVVHLAGEPLTGVRWTAAKKRRILESRVNGTLLLVDTLATLKQRPQAFVAASAIGIYGERHAELLSESAATGEEFLAETVQAWEAETARAATLGTREVRLRFGVVLGANGGALRVFARTARLGLGTVFGSGKQIVSWVALSDAARAIAHAVETSSVEGPTRASMRRCGTNWAAGSPTPSRARSPRAC
ncbi:MAG: TIGR01777 family protein [Chloroflexi bacterium]|nr:TIGR01777 family protein [Chloroflexota bacterium]